MRLYASGQWLNQSTSFIAFLMLLFCGYICALLFWIIGRRVTVKNRAVYVHGWMNEFMCINEHTKPSKPVCIYACKSFSLSAHFPFLIHWFIAINLEKKK